MAVSTLLQLGNHALLANQVALTVTGNNIANVNTDGYSRQLISFETYSPNNTYAGTIGTGVKVTEITRSFDQLLENTFLERFTQQGRYEVQSGILSSVENVFNESNRDGIASELSEFFAAWQSLSTLPDDSATKTALLAQAESLTGLIYDTKTTLEAYQAEINAYIQSDVATVNSLIESIAQLNKDIVAHTLPNDEPLALLDQRDELVRQLAELVDVEVDVTGDEFTVRLATGQPLVQGAATYGLVLQSNQIEYNTQGFTGEAVVSGSDSFEYTLELVSGEQFRLSLDGGKTWIKNADGTDLLYDVPAEGETVTVKNLDISFTTDDFKAGDTITIVPKQGLYWDSNTNGLENITPMLYSDGSDNTSRLTGGSLTAYFNTRDDNIGSYIDKLDAFAEALIWEVNSAHSQGASTYPQSAFSGTMGVEFPYIALGNSAAGLDFYNKLEEGNFSIYFYDSDTGDLVKSGAVDFDPDTPGIQNFDPDVHSLQDVAAALNSTYVDANGNQMLQARIVDGQLSITAASGYDIAVGDDTSGLLAALGINTFFTGSDATSIGINSALSNNVDLINTGQVNQAGVITEGDNSIALIIASLANQAVEISTTWETTEQTLSSYYAGLVSLVGAETANANFNCSYYTALTSDASARVESIRGVSLDEEMTNIIKFQHSYTAAAKLITTADESHSATRALVRSNTSTPDHENHFFMDLGLRMGAIVTLKQERAFPKLFPQIWKRTKFNGFQIMQHTAYVCCRVSFVKMLKRGLTLLNLLL